MATVHFAPYHAVKYVGPKSKELHVSLARPKPILKKGDIVITTKRDAFNLTKKGFGEFEEVQEISFVKADKSAQSEISSLKEKILDLETKLKNSWCSTKELQKTTKK